MENSNKEKLLGEQLSCIWKKILGSKESNFFLYWFVTGSKHQLIWWESCFAASRESCGFKPMGHRIQWERGIPEQDRSICSDFCKQIMHKHLLVKRAGKKSQQTDVHEAWEHCCKAAVLQEFQARINLVLDCIGWKHSGHTPLKTWVE